MFGWAECQRWSTLGCSFPVLVGRAAEVSWIGWNQIQCLPPAVTMWRDGPRVMTWLCCCVLGLNLRESSSPAPAVWPDYTDTRGLLKQKPGALSARFVWHPKKKKEGKNPKTLNELKLWLLLDVWRLMRSHILCSVWNRLVGDVKQTRLMTKADRL